jgi:alpha-L-rhamnosidase
MTMTLKHIILSLLAVLSLQQVLGQKMVFNLRCEMLDSPQGIDTKTPRLSWWISNDQNNIKQQAYHIIVATTKEKLNKNEGDLWNSGKVNTDRSVHVLYAGKLLTSGIKCYWKVKSYTNKGESSWSKPSYWSMGLLTSATWKAKWIGYDKASAWDSVTQWSRLSARYLRKQFQSASAVKRATVYISGLGLYELYINGKRISDYVLTPSPTDYRKSVLYNSFDVTNNIKAGNNVIATVLGNGRFFTMRQNYKTQKWNTFGFPQLLLQLEIEYANGTKKTIISDETWKLNVDGPIRSNNEYDGEEYDATKELTGWMNAGFNDTKWLKPQLVKAPEGKLVAQMTPPMKVMETFDVKEIKKVGEGKYVLDIGQNFSGWIKMKVKGKRGDKVSLRFAESLQPNGELYIANLRDAKVTDIYTLKGGETEIWQPSFVYHGFRYVEVTGYPGTPVKGDFEGHFVYDEMRGSRGFLSSNNVLNGIIVNANRGIASNYKGMPIDCPQRNERQPWLGDRATGAGGEAFLFDNSTLYAKWLDDIEQSQTEEGAIPDVAPAFWNYYSDNMTWPGTYLLVADMLHRQFGDEQVIIKHYPSMKKWMDYMRTKYMKDYILTKDKYGDWCVPPESLEIIRSRDSTRTTDGALISTAYYYWLLQYMKKFATLAGKSSDIPAYDDLAARIKQAFNDKFYNKQRKLYDNNTVTANILPLYFGITPESDKEAVFNNIYNKIKLTDKMHISTGVIGTQWLMRTLTQFQRSDIAFTLASNTSYPSWGYMLANGATTIWELWNGNTASPQMNSQNHVMLLGDLIIWMYENLAGIKSDDKAVGFSKIIMKPEMVDGLHYVEAWYDSPYGIVKSLWSKGLDDKEVNEFSWEILIPANTTATVYVPASSKSEVSLLIEKGVILDNEIKFLREEGPYVVYEVPSGKHTFNVDPRFKKGIFNDQFIFERASFPESHAPTIAETPAGLVAAWFGGTKEGNKDVCIWVSHLSDKGWTEPMKVADGVLNDSTRYACYNPVLFQVPNSELLLFYKIGPNVAGWTGWMMRSSDNGKTWSKREALPPGYLGPIKNKPVLINGTLVCPSSTERNGWKVHFELTKDWGRTWTKTDSINDGKTISAIQPSILQYADGRLHILCRSKNRTINESWSSDGGKTWSPMTASALPNNNSGTDAVTLQDGRQLLVYNHVKPDPSLPNGKGARTPLNVAVSKDGKNWEAALILEDSPISQYSYPSVIQTKDGLVHIVYTWRRERIKYVMIDPSQLILTPIVNEQWPCAKAAVQKPSDD